MDKLAEYRDLVQKILREYEEWELSGGQVRLETIFDGEKDRYLLMVVGHQDDRRVHGCFIHVDLINGKFWIHKDSTKEGVATFLLEHGVPKEHIVLAFKSPELRAYTDFAVA